MKIVFISLFLKVFIASFLMINSIEIIKLNNSKTQNSVLDSDLVPIKLNIYNSFFISNSTVNQIIENKKLNDSTTLIDNFETIFNDLETKHKYEKENFTYTNFIQIHNRELNNLSKDDLRKQYELEIGSLFKKQKEETQLIVNKYENEIKKLHQESKKILSEVKIKDNQLQKLKEENTKEKSNLQTKEEIIEQLNFQLKKLKNYKLSVNTNMTSRLNNLATKKINFNENNLPKRKENLSSITNKNVQIQNENIKLNCLSISSNEYHHFLMNFEKCKQLNKIFVQIMANKMVFNRYKYQQFGCDTEFCKFDLKVFIKDHKSEYMIYQSGYKNYELIAYPGIFDLYNFENESLNENFVKDFVTVYIYPFLAQLFNVLPNNSKFSLIMAIDSENFEKLSHFNQKRFLNILLNLQNIDDRFMINYDTLQVLTNGKNLNNNEYLNNHQNHPKGQTVSPDYFDNFRYKSRNLFVDDQDNRQISSDRIFHENNKINYDNYNYMNKGPKLYFNPYAGYNNNNFQFIRFKEKDSKISIENTLNINTNPCFNKGYYDKNLNFTGTGNFEECYSYIYKNYFTNYSNNYANKTSYLNNQDKEKLNLNETYYYANIKHNENHTYILDKQFKNFKFLFYQKDMNVYKFDENLSFQNLKKKTEKICNIQYSHLLADLSSFNIKNTSKLCFDLTFLIITLEKNKVNQSDILIMKAHKNSSKISRTTLSTYLIILNNILFNRKNVGPLAIISIFFICFVSLLLWGENLIQYFLLKMLNYEMGLNLHANSDFNYLYQNITINENNIDELLQIYKVKSFLFYDSESYFKKKYGKNFELENCDIILIKQEILAIVNNNFSNVELNTNNKFNFPDIADNLKQLFVEYKINEIEMKVYVFIHLMRIVSFLIFLACVIFIVNIMKIECGCAESIWSIIFLLSIWFCLIIILKFVFKLGNSYSDQNENYSIVVANEKNKEEDLIVLEKLNFNSKYTSKK